MGRGVKLAGLSTWEGSSGGVSGLSGYKRTEATWEGAIVEGGGDERRRGGGRRRGEVEEERDRGEGEGEGWQEG